MKRVWTSANVVTVGEQHIVELDGRPVKLPSGRSLTVSSAPLAKAIASEWENAPEDFSPEDLPFTRLASTALERVAAHRAEIIGQLAAYGLNDLLCYRAEAPESLVERQNNIWTPWLRWAEANYGLKMLSTEGLVPINQPPDTAVILRKILTSLSNDTIAALGVIVPALGSLLLGLALMAQAINPRTACETACLDELWQEEQWGVDDEAAARRAKHLADVSVGARFMYLCCA